MNETAQEACHVGGVEGWKRVMQCADGCIPLQEQSTVLHCAAVNDNPDVVQILVDSKADMEAVDEVAMRPVQPGKGKG